MPFSEILKKKFNLKLGCLKEKKRVENFGHCYEMS